MSDTAAPNRTWTQGARRLLVVLAWVPALSEARTLADTRCIVASGGAAARCVRRYADACRATADAACESGLRAPGATLECQPVALPWRYARHILAYLSLNFFDASLNGDAEALGRLSPARLGTIEDLAWQTK